jgi:hypothetical protein
MVLDFAVSSVSLVGGFTLKEAIYRYTLVSSYAEKKEHIKGKLKKGMLADFVLLSDDIFDPNLGKELKEVLVELRLRRRDCVGRCAGPGIVGNKISAMRRSHCRKLGDFVCACDLTITRRDN